MAALIPAGITAVGSIISALLSRKGSQETSTQGIQRELIDELLGSLRGGGGAFGDLFTADEETFNRSVRDPALAQFKSQITPAIQQRFIGAGQGGASGLDDALTRAGVDLNQLISQSQQQFQQGAQNRRVSALSGILGAPAGALPEQSFGSAFGQGVGGFLSSPGGEKGAKDIGIFLQDFIKNRNAPKGFEDTQAFPRIG